MACLGLYGLAAFATYRRTQAIGIRKVFGAGTWDIVRRQSFDSRIWLSAIYLVAAGLVALAIAWLTVPTRAIAPARARPAHALRCG